MTNTEFQKKLDEMYNDYPMIAISKKKTINELIFVLRNDNDVDDYCLNIDSGSQGFSFGLAKKSFFPTRTLALKIKSIEYVEDDESEYPALVITTN